MVSNNPNTLAPELLAGRYRVETELGRGGMARVYRVVDERSGKRLALKQLLVSGERSPTLRAMFEREYHTLVQLAHPHIIRVFDYGVAADDPYYTMELLEGVDAREASRDERLDVRQICLLLRDCASALALVHSRRMVHRDVSPRNLWCTPEGRGKLIDFGTLVAIGPQSRIAGTPPFVPPEALYMQPLDARCDLYALGATAYFLLTQQYAYPARTLGDLAEYWQRKPKRPHELRPEIPRALSDLVMALQNLDARGRPGSAAEVYERLSAIAELPAEDERHLAQSFLTSPALVGRGDALAFIGKRLQRSVAGRGGTLTILGPSGFGRSRMIAQVVLLAKLTGAATVSLDATAVGSSPLGLANALAERLLEALPMLPAMSVHLGPVLGHLSPALHRALGAPALVEISAQERTDRLSSAVVALVELASERQRVVIAVDDVHRVDTASLGVLGRVSLLVRDHALLLVSSCPAGILEQPPPALEQLINTRHRVELPALSAENTHELLESLFGAVTGLDEAASWMHELAGGSPQACMQYAQYLVDEGVARFEAGHWQLPLALREAGLPATLGGMFERRVAALSDDARAFALGLALARDETRSDWQPEMHVRIEDFPKLLEHGDAARASAALDELLRAGIVQQRDIYYVLAQRAVVDTLLRAAPEQLRRQTHARLANIFTQPVYRSNWLAIRQLQCAGEHARAREAIVLFASKSDDNPDWGAMRVSLQAQCASDAIKQWQAEGGSPIEGILLRRVLLVASTVYDWSLARLGDPQFARLQSDSGLSHWDDTDPALPNLQRLGLCLTRAQETYAATPEPERGFAPFDALTELCGCAILLCKAYACSFDVARVRSIVSVVDVLRPISPLVELVMDQCQAGLDRASGREFGDALLNTAERLLCAEGPKLMLLAGAVLHLHEQALEDARLGRARALDMAGRTVSEDVSSETFFTKHGRWLSHAYAGHAALAKGFRKRVEIITEDDVWRRKAYLYFEAEFHALTGDLTALSRTADMIADVAVLFEGWRPWLSFTRAAIHRVRGELAAAKNELEAALALAHAGEHRAWLLAAAAHAEILLLLGDTEGAAREAEAMLATVKTLALMRSAAVAAERVLALAHSKNQQHDRAREAMLRALSLAHELAYGGLPLAQLCEAQAQVLLAANEPAECVRVLKQLWQLLEHSDAASLVDAYEILRADSARQLASADLPAARIVANAMTTELATMYTDVQTLLAATNRRDERAAQSLKLLLEASGAQAGHLLLFDESGLCSAATANAEHASTELLREVKLYLDTVLGDVKTITQTDAGEGLPAVVSHGGLDYAAVLLAIRSDLDPMLIGIALLGVNSGALVRAPRNELVQVISQCLLTTGDSIAIAMDD